MVRNSTRDIIMATAPTPPKGAYSITEFCQAHGGFTRQFFYKLLKQGKGPRLMKIGARTLISVEAAADWRRQMEGAAV